MSYTVQGVYRLCLLYVDHVARIDSFFTMRRYIRPIARFVAYETLRACVKQTPCNFITV